MNTFFVLSKLNNLIKTKLKTLMITFYPNSMLNKCFYNRKF